MICRTRNFIWDLALSKLYSNCLLSTLNARSSTSDNSGYHASQQRQVASSGGGCAGAGVAGNRRQVRPGAIGHSCCLVVVICSPFSIFHPSFNTYSRIVRVTCPRYVCYTSSVCVQGVYLFPSNCLVWLAAHFGILIVRPGRTEIIIAFRH